MISWLLLIAVSLLITCLAILGRRSVGYARYVLYAQAIYWFVSYVVRPLVLLVVQPTPRTNDSIADPRLSFDGYVAGVQLPLFIVTVGLVTFALSSFALRRLGTPETIPIDAPYPDSFLYFLYVVGWICRLVEIFGSSNSVSSTMAGAAPIAVGLLFLASAKGDISASRLTLLAGFAAAEAVYAAAVESKTPLLAVVLFAFIAFAHRASSVRRKILAVVMAVITLVGFSLLQSTKVDSATVRALDKVDSAYPLVLHPLTSVVRRFDLFSAVTDASFVRNAVWVTMSTYGERLFFGLLPWLSRGSVATAGTLWAREVRAYTIPLNGSSVSLAEGFIAEGYALLGFPGVVVEAILFAIATKLIAGGVSSRRRLLVLVSLGMLTRPALFERGLLGFAEILGQTVQTAFACYILGTLWVRLVVESRGQTRRSSRPSISAEPVTNAWFDSSLSGVDNVFTCTRRLR